jgi:Protein of unknown function (DUF3140)
MAATEVSEELWTEFHTVVNMTSRELEEWLRTRGSGEVTEQLPDQAGGDLGRAVLDVLGKRRTDLTRHDLDVMREVVDTVRGQRNAELEPRAGDATWRHRLMALGHDPLKPA